MVSVISRIMLCASLCVFVTLGLASCTPNDAGHAKKPMMSFPPATVQVSPVGLEPFREKSDYIGTIKSRKSISLSPHVEGHITQIFVTAGEFVKAGTKLMQIDSRMQAAQTDSYVAAAESVQSDLATAKSTLASLQSSLQSKVSNVDFTKAQHTRYQNLAGQGAVAQSELDSWKNNYTAAVADRDSILQQIEGQRMIIQRIERQHKQAQSNIMVQKEQLKYYEIVAPFSGIIGDIPVKVGDHVTKTSALSTLTENHPLEVYISVPAEKASSMNKGMSVSLFSSEGQCYGDSKVSFISPTVDAGSQTVLVKTTFDNAKNQLRVDQAVRAEIVWGQKDGITVPTSAVTQTAGKHFVFLAEDGAGDKGNQKIAHQVEIEVHGIEGSVYQVKRGLKPGDKVITTGIQKLAEGAPIIEKLVTEQRAGQGSEYAKRIGSSR